VERGFPIHLTESTKVARHFPERRNARKAGQAERRGKLMVAIVLKGSL